MSRDFERRPLRVPSHMKEAFEYERPVPFSRGLAVDLGRATLVVVSGTASIDERGETVHRGDLAAQTRRTFDNVTAVLREGGADWRHVIRTRIYLRDMADYAEFNVLRRAFLDSLGLPFYPPSVCVEARLCRDDLLVEIEAEALVEKPRAATGSRTRRTGSAGRRRGRSRASA